MKLKKHKQMKYFKQFSIIFILIFITSCSEDTVDYTGVGKVTGRVVEAENFDPLENAKVELTPTKNTVFTDVEGYFVFEEVEAGDYSVSATKEGFLTSFEPVTVTTGLEVNTVLELEIETANNRPPSTPELLAPEDNAQGIDLAVELIWSSKDPENDTKNIKFPLKTIEITIIQLLKICWILLMYYQI